MKCKYGCGKEAKYQLKDGSWICKKSPNSCSVLRKINSKRNSGFKPNRKGNKTKGRIPWNKGLTKKTDKRLEKLGKKISKNCRGNPNFTGKGKTIQSETLRRKKISATMKKKGGGYRRGSGRGKKGWYKGYWCDSSWELAWIIYQLDNGISFKRNTKKFTYIYRKRNRRWLPDFILKDGTYVEVKGYFTKQAKAKISSFKKKLLVVGKKEISPILKYVESKYGKDFIKLYGKRKSG